MDIEKCDNEVLVSFDPPKRRYERHGYLYSIKDIRKHANEMLHLADEIEAEQNVIPHCPRCGRITGTFCIPDGCDFCKSFDDETAHGLAAMAKLIELQKIGHIRIVCTKYKERASVAFGKYGCDEQPRVIADTLPAAILAIEEDA